MSRDLASRRVDELSALYGLEDRQCARLLALLALIAQDDRAPTAVRDPALGVDLHLADSLVALDLAPVRAAKSIADIGSGAGFPGFALAVARSECDVVVIESQSRKCAFLEGVLAQVEIPNARVICARAEDWSGGICAHDVVVARALGPQPVVLEYAAPLLRLGGTLVDWRGMRVPAEEQRAAQAADELGLALVGVERVEPFEAARDRHLHVYAKVRETPAKFPRRAGMARKRPLGT
jgi:16S rRNA (guanine527-N7)-methyltransferase